MAPDRSSRTWSLRSYLLLLVLVVQVPLVALVVLLALQRQQEAWGVAAGALLVAGAAVAAVVAGRLGEMTKQLRMAARAVVHGETPVTSRSPIHELDEVATLIASSGRMRRETEGRLRAAETRLTAILAGSPVAVLAVDADRKVTLFNRAAETLFGCAVTAAVGSPAARFVSQRCLRLIDAHLDAAHGRLRALTAGGEAEGHVGFRSDGSEVAIAVEIARVETAAGPLAIVVARDVADERRRDEERAEQLRHSEA